MNKTIPLIMLGVLFTVGCTIKPGTPVKRHGDEIMVAGQMFRVGTPVVLWIDPGGYDAYRVDKRFSSFDKREFSDWSIEDQAKDPQRYNTRDHGMTPQEMQAVRGGGWELAKLQEVIDQFVIHYDACGTSRRCFEVLHDHRHLSVHFLLDLDGTIYQTLDLKERAWHATHANSRSVGIEITNIGAYAADEEKPWDLWYAEDVYGSTYITIPNQADRESLRQPHFVGRPSRNEPVAGEIQDRFLEQYDLTDEQYDALIRLTVALHKVFPKMKLEVPRDNEGHVISHVLPSEFQDNYAGLIGHYHIQANKIDPGPAFDWERLLEGAKKLAR